MELVGEETALRLSMARLHLLHRACYHNKLGSLYRIAGLFPRQGAFYLFLITLLVICLRIPRRYTCWTGSIEDKFIFRFRTRRCLTDFFFFRFFSRLFCHFIEFSLSNGKLDFTKRNDSIPGGIPLSNWDIYSFEEEVWSGR